MARSPGFSPPSHVKTHLHLAGVSNTASDFDLFHVKMGEHRVEYRGLRPALHLGIEGDVTHRPWFVIKRLKVRLQKRSRIRGPQMVGKR